MFRFPVKARDFSLLDSVQNGFGFQQATYSRLTERHFSGDEGVERKSDHTRPPSNEVTNAWS